MHSFPLAGCSRVTRRVLAIAVAVGFGLATASPARAQPPGAPGQLKSLEKEDQLGQVVEVGPGMLQLRLPKGGALWQAMPAPNAKIEVTGKASREMLQPKQFVSCVVTLDEFGKVTEPAARVMVTDGGTPGVVAGGLGLAEPGAKRVSGKRPAGSYTIFGTIKQVEGDIVTVQVGRERFDITVPADAELVVLSSNVAIATPGDHIEVEGQFYQRGQLMLSSLKVTLTNPLSPPPPKNKSRRPQ